MSIETVARPIPLGNASQTIRSIDKRKRRGDSRLNHLYAINLAFMSQAQYFGIYVPGSIFWHLGPNHKYRTPKKVSINKRWTPLTIIL
ncbi:hypothetical protein BUY42_02280 [Staphylococcus devriesei]|nr:hypothetical protein BUY42_02280 [Staphylococcus devriesei]